MNVLVRGVRFSMRIGRANCVKNIVEPKADSTDTKDFFYMGDADPDRVCTGLYSHLPGYCLLDAHTDLPSRGVADHGRGDQGIHPRALQRSVPPRECLFTLLHSESPMRAHAHFADVVSAHQRLPRYWRR